MGELKKVLGYRVILLITINSIIGSGMFFLPAIGAKISGPASIIAWLILSLSAIYTAMVFAELISLFPKAGGIYEFCKRAYGSFFSFIIGWIAWIVGNVTTAMLIVGAIQYLLPYHSTTMLVLKIAICLFWVAVFNFMAYRGMETSSFMLVTFAIITVTIILSLILPSLFHLDPANLHPFFVSDVLFTNVSLIFLTIFFISEAFFGLESVLFLAEETKNPEQVLPKALIHATLIITALTLVLVTVSLMVMHYVPFGASEAPFADLAFMLLGDNFRSIIILGTYLVIMGAAAGWVVTGPRLILSLTRDRMFPPKFGELHPIHDSPYNAIKFQAFATATLVLVGFLGKGYETLLAMLVPLVLIMMSASLLTLTILRAKQPYLKRPYKAPLGNVGPIILVLFNASLITTWLFLEHDALNIAQLVGSIILLGVPIYFFLQMQYNPGSMTKVSEALAYFTLVFERLLVPGRVRREILRLLGDIKGKSVFEYGCSVGTMTMHLAEEVGPYGKIFATDFSARNIQITKQRMKKQGHEHVSAIFDKDHTKRIHPDVPQIDIITSIAVLGSLHHIDNVLADMNRRLRIGNKVCFVEYDKVFGIISNINWLASDNMVKHIFRKSGFLVNIERKQGLFWQYVYIYGKKVLDIEHIKTIGKLERNELHDDEQPLIGTHGHVKELITELKDQIVKADIGLAFYDDRQLDSINFSVSTKFFDRVFTIPLEIGIHYAPPGHNLLIIMNRLQDELSIEYLMPISNEISKLFTEPLTSEQHYEQDTLIHKERVADMRFLQDLVTKGYRGKIRMDHIKEDYDPTKHKELRKFILGFYDERVIRRTEDYIQINIRIPYHSIS